MAHPDHYQIVGQLAGARLRGPAKGRDLSGGPAEVHPDAEAWAAYVDGGLQPDEAATLEAHLAGCGTCRGLVAALMPEVSSGAVTAVRETGSPEADRGVVIPFPQRRVFVWMAAAAGLLMAVTLWSVSRLGSGRPVASVAMSTPEREAGPPAAPATAPAPPAPAAEAAARQEQDAPTASRGDALARRKAAPAATGAAAGRFADAATPADQKPAVPAEAPAVSARSAPSQSNAAPAVARPRGPLANQQAINQQAIDQQAANQPAANQQAANQLALKGRNEPADAEKKALQAAPAAAAPSPVPAEPVAQAATRPAPPAAAPAVAEARERQANAQADAGLTESVTTTSSAATRGGARRAERGQAKAAEGEGATSKDEAARAGAAGFAAFRSAPSFAEPGGRLQWRIAEGRRLESSSDGGNKWTAQYTTRGRLRAGAAPAIDSAWAVGEGGLVLRFVVPGGWAEVSRPAAATLIAVSATGVQSARVTADDGRVFETADGGATWTPATPGADPR